MKIKFLLLISTVLFWCIACYNTPKEETIVEQKDDKLIVQKEFDILTLPKEWIRLTQTDSGFVVFNSCDAGNLLITIVKGKHSSSLLLHGSQEDYEFEILKSYLGTNDTVLIKAKWINSNELQDFKFVWINKEKKQGQWITQYSSGFTSNFLFVSTDQQTQYPKVDQPCIECWGEECDEITQHSIENSSDKNNNNLVLSDLKSSLF